MEPSWTELLRHCLLVLGFFAVMALPATWLSVRVASDWPAAGRIGVGTACGFGLFVLLAWLTGLRSLQWLPWAWVGQAAVLVAAALGVEFCRRQWRAGDSGRQSRLCAVNGRTGEPGSCRATHGDAGAAQQELRPPGSPSNGSPPVLPAVEAAQQELRPPGSAPVFIDGTKARDSSRALLWAALPLLAAAALHLYAFHQSELPLGLDPTFHCVVAQRIHDAGQAVSNLWPLEEQELNYPIGTHLWVAVAARWTGLEVHQVFRISFLLALCGAGLMVGAWSERLFGSPMHAAAGTFCFTFASFQASLFPYTWGGLPSALAMWQALAALYCVLAGRGLWSLAAGALLFGSTALTHHHTMVAVFGGSALAALLTAASGRIGRQRRGRMAAALAGGLAVAAPYLLPHLQRLGQLGQTGILSYSEPFAWPWQHMFSWGPALVAAAAVGLAVPAVAGSGPARRLLVALAAVWLAAFALLDYGGRWFTSWYTGRPVTPFTPSRFLFDAQHLLAILAAGGLVRVAEWARLLCCGGRLRMDRSCPGGVAARAGRYGLVAGVLAAIVAWAIEQTGPRLRPVPADVLLPAGRWVRRNLPPDALMVSDPQMGLAWVSYVCNRESTSLFVPISEPASRRRALKQRMAAGIGPAVDWSAWRRRLGKPLYAIGPAAGPYLGRQPVHVCGPVGIYRLSDH